MMIKTITQQRPTKVSPLESKFSNLWISLYPRVKLYSQYLLVPNRDYRFDFVHLPSQVAIEIQGGIWVKSRHNTGTGLRDSYEKLNLANFHGWQVFQLSSDMIDEIWLAVIYMTIKDRWIDNK